VNTSPESSSFSVTNSTESPKTDSATNQPNLQTGQTDDPLVEKSTQTLDKGALAVLGSTFITIFLAEVGDKTQLAVLLISAESQKPWVVFTGAAVALIATSLLGVMLGKWLSTRVSPKTLERSAAVILLFISATLFWDVLH
jgi:putative Ca2+/H+ antiporter (TMEM165/GDT1 family)